MSWRLADAKNRFSELVNRALRGERMSFKQFLLGEGPSLRGVDLRRDKSPMRNVKL